nr:hypothetical protein [Bifidobacterium aerophilum]
MPLERLDGHRFIAVTSSGQTIDGWLKYHPRLQACFDTDDLLLVIGSHAGTNHPGHDVKAVNVLDEARR